MMAETREGEHSEVFRREGRSHEIEEGSAPQIHLQGSSTQGGPSLGTSSNTRSNLPVAPEEREEGSAPRYFALSTPIAVFAALADAALGYCLGCIFPRDQRRPRMDPDALASSSTPTTRHSETGVGSSVIKSPPGDSGLTQRGDLVGLLAHKEQLIKLLLEDDSGTAHVLVRGGSGMTALVRKVCEDVCGREEHFGTIAWISAPQINDELIHEEILLQLLFESAPFPDDIDAYHREGGYFTNSSEYNKARCLIVIDNLVDPRTQKALKKVSRLFETYKVIFMARRDSPLNTYGCQCVFYELEDLSVEEPWAHSCLKKSPSGDFSSQVKKVCKLVLRKFGSLPGAIVLHLRDRKERKWAPMILPSFNLIRQVWEILSNEDRLFCLLYLSIFPENSEISCNRLSRLWVAEGFLPDLRVAEGFFNDLLDRKCIHPAEKRSDGELSTFRVDNLVREIIVALSDHRNLLTIISQPGTNGLESGRYLSVHGTIRDLKEEKTFQLSSTFALDASSNGDKTMAFESSPLKTSETHLFPSKSKHSKVLDLKDAPFRIVPDGWFELTDLRYWSIRNTSIKVIPSSIEKLLHLEFLDAKHSLVIELPKEAEGLERIRHILIYHHEKDPRTETYDLIGFKASCRVGGFLFLEKLCFVEADKRTLKDLGNLKKLRRLGITKLREEDGEKLCISIKELKELKSLNVHAFNEDEIIDLHALTSPPKNLKHLYLHGFLEELPNWISSCKCLTKILLRWSHLEEDLLSTLGQLPELIELELRRAYDGEQLNFKKGQFPKLKILLLEELQGLISMSLEKETMLCLEDLTIRRCQWLESIPSGIEYIGTIRKLAFFDMSNEFYENVRADHEKDRYTKFEHIPELYFTRWKAGHWETHQVKSTNESQQVKSTDEAHCSRQVESSDEAHKVKSTDEAHCSIEWKALMESVFEEYLKHFRVETDTPCDRGFCVAVECAASF